MDICQYPGATEEQMHVFLSCLQSQLPNSESECMLPDNHNGTSFMTLPSCSPSTPPIDTDSDGSLTSDSHRFAESPLTGPLDGWQAKMHTDSKKNNKNNKRRKLQNQILGKGVLEAVPSFRSFPDPLQRAKQALAQHCLPGKTVTLSSESVTELLEEADLKRKRLARKAELARVSRKRKKMRIEELEADVARLRAELEQERKRSGVEKEAISRRDQFRQAQDQDSECSAEIQAALASIVDAEKSIDPEDAKVHLSTTPFVSLALSVANQSC